MLALCLDGSSFPGSVHIRNTSASSIRSFLDGSTPWLRAGGTRWQPPHLAGSSPLAPCPHDLAADAPAGHAPDLGGHAPVERWPAPLRAVLLAPRPTPIVGGGLMSHASSGTHSRRVVLRRATLRRPRLIVFLPTPTRVLSLSRAKAMFCPQWGPHVGDEPKISYYFHVHPNSYLCERRKKVSL